jgi:uncharacterized protein YjgD (DUF1641 family)
VEAESEYKNEGQVIEVTGLAQLEETSRQVRNWLSMSLASTLCASDLVILRFLEKLEQARQLYKETRDPSSVSIIGVIHPALSSEMIIFGAQEVQCNLKTLLRYCE